MGIMFDFLVWKIHVWISEQAGFGEAVGTGQLIATPWWGDAGRCASGADGQLILK